MYHRNSKKESGFIALISAVIIMMLLLTITLSLSFSGFFGRNNILVSESKEKSFTAAQACVESAILNISLDSTYNPVNQVVSVGSNNCAIISLQNNIPTTGQKTIKTQSIINEAVSNLQVVIDSSTYSVLTWQEVASF